MPPLDDLPGGAVTPMSGGVDAPTYLVRAAGVNVVAKINEQWLRAEGEALRAWRRTPAVAGPTGPGHGAAGAVPVRVLTAAYGQGFGRAALGSWPRSRWR